LIAQGKPVETDLEAVDVIVIAGIRNISGLNTINIIEYRT
jgi:hypothetical protein